jgi:hypothetical protein
VPRLHLIELHEQSWFPRSIRDVFTELLTGIAELTQIYDVAWPRLVSALARTGSTRIVDLCSGSGGPILGLLARHGAWTDAKGREVVLTDLHPAARAPRSPVVPVRYEPRSVDALHVPIDLDGFRTIFSAFHHFRPEEARSILQDTVNEGRGIAIFEMTERTILAVLAMSLSPLLGLAGLARMRPWPFSRWLWACFLPVALLLVTLDGIFSCLRTYSPEELRALVREVEGADRYDWEIEAVRAGLSPIRTTYLIGVPKAARLV